MPEAAEERYLWHFRCSSVEDSRALALEPAGHQKSNERHFKVRFKLLQRTIRLL